MNKPPRHSITTAKEIYQTEYPPPEFLVPGMFPLPGLTILAGPAKGGKSWFVLLMHVLLSKGGIFLGRIFLKKRRGLYLALEDSEARLHHRMHSLGIEPGEDCLIITAFPTGKEGLSCLRKILTDDRTIIYIIIDTLGKLSAGRGKGGFQEDYDWIGSIKEIADEFRVSIILVHHLRKMGDEVDNFNEISGSCGSLAVADAILVLKKERNSGNGTLSCTGRDFDETKYDVFFSKETYLWSIKGESVETASTPERQAILDVLKLYGEMTPIQISGHIARTPKAVSNTLSKLKEEGLVAKGCKYGSWISTESIDSSTSSAFIDESPTTEVNQKLFLINESGGANE